MNSHDGIAIHRTKNVGIEAAVLHCILILYFGYQPGFIDLEELHLLTIGLEEIRHIEHLIECRAVDEALAFERGQHKCIPAEILIQIRLSDEMINVSHIKLKQQPRLRM